MTGSRDELVEYRLERAQEALEEARLMADWGHPNTAVNRLYYACFYAVSALLLAKGLSAVKHSGIRSLFGQHYVKTGLISKELAAFYNDLFESRQESDYEDFFRVDPDLIGPWLNQAEQFIAAIVQMLEAASGP
jgi:uncharacterized protein (UPF0332 family)